MEGGDIIMEISNNKFIVGGRIKRIWSGIRERKIENF